MERDELISGILELEWGMFTNTNNAGGRASCQDDKPTFMIMRSSQAEIWSQDTLLSYKNDLESAWDKGLNLMGIKYAHMMKITYPEEYELIKKVLPPVSERALELADEIVKYHSIWTREAADRYPYLIALGRPVSMSDSQSSRYASMDNYLHSELLTYSEATLEYCLADTIKAYEEDRNLSLEILKNTAKHYGFETLEAIEDAIRNTNSTSGKDAT